MIQIISHTRLNVLLNIEYILEILNYQNYITSQFINA